MSEVAVVLLVLLWACWLLWSGRTNSPGNRRTREMVEEWRSKAEG